MKRTKNSRARCPKGINEEAEAGEVKIQHSGCSFMSLPSHIVVDILLRLSIKEIIVCKCTCKSWYATISNPEFANVHYAQSEVFPIVRTTYSTSMSRILYLLELEKDERFMDRFQCQKCYGYYEHSCCVCHVNLELDYKLKLPLRNLQLISKGSTIGSDMDDSEIVYDYHHKIVNSCNGFLCLSEPTDNPVVVFNPITGEFINLPRGTMDKKVYGFHCGFGYSPTTKQYKVVRIFKQARPPKRVLIPNDYSADHDTIKCFLGQAQVHTLGTESWKDIGGAPYSGYKLTFPTYLNGAVHWFCLNNKKLIFIVSFDCENECFQLFSSPPWFDGRRSDGGHPSISTEKEDYVGMGVLGGCLCVCDSSDSSLTSVWVMKDYGVGKSWTKVFEINMSFYGRWSHGLCQPIKCMNNGAILMFNYPRSCLIYYDQRKPGLKHFMFRGANSKAEIIAHTPSFISLKDVISGCNMEVLNVYSRCAKLKLEGEARAISLYRKTKFDVLYESDVDAETDIDYHEYLVFNHELEEYWWGRF